MKFHRYLYPCFNAATLVGYQRHYRWQWKKTSIGSRTLPPSREAAKQPLDTMPRGGYRDPLERIPSSCNAFLTVHEKPLTRVDDTQK